MSKSKRIQVLSNTGIEVIMKAERNKLQDYLGWLVEVKAKVGVLKKDHKLRVMDTVMLKEIEVFPVGDKAFELDNLWVFRSKIEKLGIRPVKGMLIRFTGVPYVYASGKNFGIRPLTKKELTKIRIKANDETPIQPNSG